MEYGFGLGLGIEDRGDRLRLVVGDHRFGRRRRGWRRWGWRRRRRRGFSRLGLGGLTVIFGQNLADGGKNVLHRRFLLAFRAHDSSPFPTGFYRTIGATITETVKEFYNIAAIRRSGCAGGAVPAISAL